MGLTAMAPLLHHLWLLARDLDCQTSLIAVQAAGRGYYNWASLAGQGPWRYLGAGSFNWGTDLDLREFLLGLRPDADTEVWIGGRLSAQLQSAVAANPRIRFLGTFEQQFSATQLAHLAWCSWQTDAGWQLPQHLTPVYPQDL